MNEPKHRLTSKDNMIIEIVGKHLRLKLVRVGEHTSIPRGLTNWDGGTAEENGVIAIWGHRGEIGSFIPISVLKKVIKELEKESKNGSDNDNS